ncbi:MAG: hypothetical protein V1929_13450 [bacterium]
MDSQDHNAGGERWTRRAPMFLSAFVCPGAGQLMQRRWLAAALYGAAFLIPFCYLATYVLYRLFTNLKNVISWNMNEADKPIEPMSFVSIVAPFLIAMVVYVAGLFDTYFAEKRRAKTR